MGEHLLFSFSLAGCIKLHTVDYMESDAPSLVYKIFIHASIIM